MKVKSIRYKCRINNKYKNDNYKNLVIIHYDWMITAITSDNDICSKLIKVIIKLKILRTISILSNNNIIKQRMIIKWIEKMMISTDKYNLEQYIIITYHNYLPMYSSITELFKKYFKSPKSPYCLLIFPILNHDMVAEFRFVAQMNYQVP